MSVPPTYFTCTLGQASALNIQQSHKTISALLDTLARDSPDQPAVAFPIPATGRSWSYRIYTFDEIVRGSECLAKDLLSRHQTELSGRATVGLLCPSTPEFLFTWLALIRLGHAVLLIAPQCAAPAISSLCEQCEVGLLLCDDSYADLASDACKQSTQTGQNLTSALLPFAKDLTIEDLLISMSKPSAIDATIAPEDVAYLHHTSGTSTGIPKPIPQPHNAAVGVLPRFSDNVQPATFTTTPLYHGGVADLFRAWASSALIWLFPGKTVPITASNIIRCLDVAKGASRSQNVVPEVKYFSSVPYVLQILAEERAGLEHLQSMDMVGVGGAALPVEVGDKLVSQHINLLSRFGSAECGFLLSSHRDYASDKSWQYLRPAPNQEYIRFEDREAGLSELVVLKGWPHMAKRNREDGSFATSDLFEPHPDIPDAWRYHSRADSQLTLITGKKFDPAPLEAALSTLPQVSEAIIFGSGRPYPGVLLFRSASGAALDDADFLEAVWIKVMKLNEDSQDHAKLSRAMLVPMSTLKEPLEKSSKGTLLRGVAEQRFADAIDNAYDDEAKPAGDVTDEDLPCTIERIIRNVSHRRLDLDGNTDLFSAGIDSVAGMQIRSRLRALLPEDNRNVPMTVVEDCGTIDRLTEWIKVRRSGQNDDLQSIEDDHERMRTLVEEYSKFNSQSATTDFDVPENNEKLTVILTGATGALGAHILDQYHKLDSVQKVYCLVRGTDHHAAQQRLVKAMQQRKLSALDCDKDNKVVVLQAKLGEDDLGLETDVYDLLAREATTIVHVAWSVNFRMRLSSFVKDNIASVTNLINLALASPRRSKPVFSFCSSVASSMACSDGFVPEKILDDPATATPLGYSKSKWVAEQICARADAGTAMRGRIAVFRVGQLAGDTVHGVWNSSEAWPIMLSSATATHCLPALKGEIVDWLPVDIAAASLIEGTSCIQDQGSSGVQVFHVLNSHTEPAWTKLIAWLQTYEDVDGVSPASWVQQIEKLEATDPSHPALKLLSHWQRAYSNPSPSADNTMVRKQFATGATTAKIPVLRSVKPVDAAYFGKLWRWIQQEM